MYLPRRIADVVQVHTGSVTEASPQSREGIREKSQLKLNRPFTGIIITK